MLYPDGDGKTRRILREADPYQGNRLARALPWARRGVAVDAGAHVGLWAVQLAPVFDKVLCFEPQPVAFTALKENTRDLANVELFKVGLGDHACQERMTGFSLGAHIVDRREEANTVPITIATLDSFEIAQVDFLKVDVEGFEPFVIEGGRETIMRSKPVIVIEQKHARYGRKITAAVELLQSWGAAVEWRMKHDYCLRWRNA